MSGARLFFGAGAGRCGTMMLANLLNAEPGVLALHEGKVRRLEQSEDQYLPFLTLENLQAYHAPERSREIFADRRKTMAEIASRENLRALGDIAYNNSPFVGVIPEIFPEARLIVLTRDGRSFVRSVYTADRPDPTPVGWLDDDVELTDLERYIALGRLRPRRDDPLAQTWRDLDPVEKNAWLWAETHRLIMDGVKQGWPEDQVRIVKAEDMFADPRGIYTGLRAFLGLEDEMGAAVETLLDARINARSSSSSYILPKPTEWDAWTRAKFDRFAGAMMKRLGYA